MNRELKRISALVLVMFASLFVASSIVQVFQADALADDQRNRRAREELYEIQRGKILTADGTAIVTSPRSGDEYRFDRRYEQGPLYAAVTGYYHPIGAPTGIEGAMNEQLAGTSSTQVFDRLQNVVTGRDPQGASVQLTIEPAVQQAAWDALGDLRGAVVAIEPETGAVLAMVSKPSFDPNRIAAHDTGIAEYEQLVARESKPLDNRAIAGDLNPPGSTFKVVTASAALESGRFQPDTEFPSPASYTLPGTTTTVKNSTGEPCTSGKRATIAEALARSCNIPFAELAPELGQEQLRTTAELFGFNQALSIPLKVTPSVFPAELDDAQLSQSAFGQFDDQATPMQMAMVSAAIGNGGTLMKPDLVQQVLSPSLDELDTMTPEVLAEPVSDETARAVTEMMVASVASGAGTNARIEGVDVAGKTGTAQNGADEPYTLWFTGFAPAENPRVAVAVVIEDGGGQGQSGYGNLIAAPIARRVMEAVLNS